MKKRTLSLAVVFVLLITGCKGLADSSTTTNATGEIIGKALYQGSAAHQGIAVTLEKTDGLRSVSAAASARSAGMAARSLEGSTTTAADGSYRFSGIAAGTYTVYASSKDSKERAVAANVIVEAGRSVTAADLNLTPVGGLSGRVKLDGNDTGNMGFLVFIASTSYMAVTGDNGNFTISDVPTGSYQVVVMKGDYTVLWNGNTTYPVTAGSTTALGDKTVASADIGNGSAGLQWQGSLAAPPASPQLNWAYYNTTDKKSYIWDGDSWEILTQDGEQGEQGEQGAPGAGIVWQGSLSAHPANPKLNWAYYNTTDKKSYIYTGVGWYILAQDGANGEQGAPGAGIVWQGSLAEHPANPQINWAYYNTTDKKSYIYTGVGWYILTQDGANGEQGAPGAGIVWQGSLSEHPADPKLNWAYYNYIDKMSYIWDGYSWELLTQDGTSLITALDLSVLVTTPAAGIAPNTTAINTAQYTGTVAWQTNTGSAFAGPVFAPDTVYKAVVTLAVKSGYTFAGLPANSFTCAGATAVTNGINSGVVIIIFPETGTATVTSLNLSGLVAAPVENAAPNTTAIDAAQYTGTIVWRLGNDQSFTGPTFGMGVVYKAVVTLAAKSGYTFAGVGANSFTYAGATSVTNGANSGTVTVTFAATGAGVLIPVTALDLTSLVAVPVKGQTPNTATINAAQYTVNIVWRTSDNQYLTGLFLPGIVYKATVMLAPNGYYTFTGVGANSFTHTGATSVTNGANSGTATVTFPMTVPDVVTVFDLTSLITPPIIGASNYPSISGEQYYGSSSWQTSDNQYFYGTFAAATIYKAEIPLTAYTGYTFAGVGANSFTHSGATSVTNAANSGTVTLTFPMTPAENPLDVILAYLVSPANVSKGLTTGDPIPVTLTSPCELAALYDVLEIAGKYVALDLSASGITTWPGVSESAAGKAKIVSLILPDAVITLDSGFSGFSNLASISGANVRTIGGFAFYNCTSLASVSLPVAASITSSTFYGCTSLASVSLPVAASIGNSAFYGCTSLASVSLPVAASIGSNAFSSCTSLTSVNLPAAASIGDYAFSSCTSLTSVSLPVAASIGDWAFYNCTSLASVSLPVAASIGDYAFFGCTSLASVTLGTTPPTLGLDGGNSYMFAYAASTPKTITFYVPASALATYQATSPWSDKMGDTAVWENYWDYSNNNLTVALAAIP